MRDFLCYPETICGFEQSVGEKIKIYSINFEISLKLILSRHFLESFWRCSSLSYRLCLENRFDAPPLYIPK
jgi:hypothetical protein